MSKIPVHVITQEEVDEWEAEQPTVRVNAVSGSKSALESFIAAAERDPGPRQFLDDVEAALEEGADLVDILEAMP